MNEVLRTSESLLADGRFSRFELISWWDQERLHNARALVVGAGALGNEIIKNLALLGVGRVVVADLDEIELSNLSRSVLYRPEDCGRAKADAAAERAREIYPEMRTHPLVCNVVFDLGLGIYRWADLILGGLDNREARVAINRAAARVGKPWIDGAIERLSGVARVFDPATGPCYECTMSDVDWRMLEARRSCALLSRDEMEQGKVPTTPTSSSIVAGMQVQEALKMLHGQEALSGQGIVFDGVHHQNYVVTYTQLKDCPSHDAFESIETLPLSIGNTTARALLGRIREDLGDAAVLEFNQDLLESLECAECQQIEPRRGSLGRIAEADGVCPSCGSQRRPNIYHTLSADSPLLDCTLQELGVPPWDIVTGRYGQSQRHYELIGDRGVVLGDLEAGALEAKP